MGRARMGGESRGGPREDGERSPPPPEGGWEEKGGVGHGGMG